VSALFDVTLEAIVPERFHEVQGNILREFDKLENDAKPTVSISSEELHFGRINFLEPTTKSMTLVNTGPVAPLSDVTNQKRELYILNSMNCNRQAT
jgi:hypothetical protein